MRGVGLHDVLNDGNDLRAFGLGLLRQLIEQILAPGHGYDADALARQRFCDGASDADAGAGYDGGFRFELKVHVVFFLLV